MVLNASTAVAYQAYDSAVAVQIMRANAGAFGQLRAAAAEGDFLSAAGALATLAEGSLRLREFEAPKGSQDEWVRIHTELMAAALQGIVACSEEDESGLADAVAAMGELNGAGHGQFK